MAEVKYRVCDKCGERLDKPRTWKIWKVATATKVRLSYRTPDPYNYSDYDYELCDKCGESLHEFLKKPRMAVLNFNQGKPEREAAEE